ncbi:MAG: glycosyl hydrolase [Chlorobi bacterium]|nr:glycosyl hydrolase [Chlorobiota bacterium]
MMFLGLMLSSSNLMAEKKKDKDKEEDKEEVKSDTIKSGEMSGLKFRSIGPAFTSGRIADFAVNPDNPSEYLVAAACGHIWKTTNNGTTFKPVFDNKGAYSIGCLARGPVNHNLIWAGTGENNHQRALGYGDGVYKSTDGGNSWKNMGLKESRQIGMIAIDPRDENVVYVAAEGSAWGPGGERGLYKTVDGGENWEKILEISENTGVNNVVLDPRNPDVIYATSEQRRRHVFTKIGGGPESNIHKSTDGGKTWKKLTSGIPKVDKGGMGIAISPVNPDVVYVIIEAAMGKGGFFRSDNRGESFSKMSSYNASGQYYNEIYCDPYDVDKVYSMETISKFTNDGGKTWKRIGNKDRHVDDHAFWIDPRDVKHFYIAGDGGVYETFDAGKTYIHKSNLPVTQFYRVAVDNTYPFYWVYGGTQDNSSYGGPSRNLNYDGVTSCEWVTTLGGDGFWQAVDPENPDIVYSEYQYGNIYRYDKKSGESINIKPKPRKDELTYKWNWNTPFIISSHSASRIYMAANKVFRSDDRGQGWTVISDDITAQIDRNTWPVMDRYWGIDAVQKDVSTSLYGMAVSFAESPLNENLLLVGTDDGLIQVTDDGGENWTKISSFPGVPENTYVSDIFCSRFDENIVFASFDNRKRDDFKPYLFKSTDRGNTWVSISANLPENGTVHAIAQDFVDADLLFSGTEFGVFFSNDGGNIWTQLKSGIPTIAVRDIAIQERETDLVLATFGRGFYIMDNYSPLREVNRELFDTTAYIFPVKDALLYVQRSRGGYGSGSDGYLAKNPPYGATFTYYVKESPKTLQQKRRKKEKELIKEKAPIPIPGLDSIRIEEKEVKPYLVFTITGEDGEIIRKLTKSISTGINRLNWNLRYPGTYPVHVKDGKYDPLSMGGNGMYVLPGKYFVSLSQVVRGEMTELVGPVEFTVKSLDNATLPAENRAELVAFQKKLLELSRVVSGAENFTEELMERVVSIKQSAQRTPAAPLGLMTKIEDLEKLLDDILWTFNGQQPKASREENLPAIPSINERLGSIAWIHSRSTSGITKSQKDIYEILKEEFPPILKELKAISEVSLPEIEKELERYGAPWTPGRLPEWHQE